MALPSIQPGFSGVVGPIISAIDLNGNTVKVIAPSFVPLLPDGTVPSATNAPGVSFASSALSAAPSFTRPADTTPYASGDLVANNTTAASVVPLVFAGASRIAGGAGRIRRARIKKSAVSITNAQFRVHIYSATIATIANGDNGVWSTDGATNYLGALDVTVDKAFTDGAVGYGAPLVGTEILFDLPGSATALYGLLEARAAYTPGNAETFVVSLEIAQD